MSKPQIITPSTLAFARIIEPTDGYFYQCNSASDTEELKPVTIQERAIRTTKSHRFKDTITKKEDKFREEASQSNIQLTQVAYLDEDCDTLVVNFGIKVLPFNGNPDSCNNPEYKEKLMQVVADYAEKTGFKELSQRYATNIANGRWLWRNRYVAKKALIKVIAKTDDAEHTFEFDTSKLSLKVVNASELDLNISKLAELIADSLKGEQYLTLEVTAHADIGYAHQVFPSEEMNLAEVADNASKKQLFQIKGVAGFHAPKIGNALRTIDTWFDDYDSYGAPISIEVYGAVTRIAEAFRVSSSKTDFYNLLDKWIENDVEPSLENQHYIMAVLIRGGLFGKSSK